MQASDGRADTLELAKRVNEYQSRLRGATRKIMATVSELSMYQVLETRACLGWEHADICKIGPLSRLQCQSFHVPSPFVVLSRASVGRVTFCQQIIVGLGRWR